MADNYIAIPCDLDKPATRRRKTPFKTRRSDEATNRSSESAKIVERRFYGGNDGARAVSADFYVARVYARVATSLKRKIVAVNSRNSDRRRGKRAISRITRGQGQTVVENKLFHTRTNSFRNVGRRFHIMHSKHIWSHNLPQIRLDGRQCWAWSLGSHDFSHTGRGSYNNVLCEWIMFSSSSGSRWRLLRFFSRLGRQTGRRSGNTIRLRTGDLYFLI
ncbi:uncharacterized protein [Oscarella lobularis]|uniref:uncharacterized protein n=1 Tax=Oscarella lobularis TaxID=121494 RepID=UPI003313EF14